MEFITENKKMIETFPSVVESIRYSIRKRNLTEKQVLMELNIDKGHWSRIMSGEAHFPLEKIFDLFSITGNVIPLQYIAMRAGYEIKPLQSVLEQELSEVKNKNEKLEGQLDAITALLKKAGINI